MIFTEKYYTEIWGTVHRHDYCESRAAHLISKYGKCRILDVGTGCGELVRLLREKGCDAWGTEISQHALNNICAPGFVLYGDVTDLPFRDDRFDVVCSQGLWEYVREEDVPKAVEEIHRVGKHQDHMIDHDKCDYRPDFLTWKSLGWWDEALKPPKVLVACPTHELKEYAHSAWVDAVMKLDYDNFDVFVVDNSPTPDCWNRWKDSIGEWVHHPVEGDMAQRIAASMEVIRQKFLSGNYKWWFNLEIDVIPDPRMLKYLIKKGGELDWTSHAYPARGEETSVMSGFGCSLFSRRIIEAHEFKGTGDCKGVDAYMWDVVRPMRHLMEVEFWNVLPIKHMKES